MSVEPVTNPLPITILLLTISNEFMTFAWYAHLKEPLKLDYLWAAFCILGALFFVFRNKWFGQKMLLYDMFVSTPLEV